MKIPLPIKVYADFDTDSKVLSKQIPIAVGLYLVSPFGNCYYSYFDESCVTWFVNEMLTLEHETDKYLKLNTPLKMTPEEEDSSNSLPYVGFVKVL